MKTSFLTLNLHLHFWKFIVYHISGHQFVGSISRRKDAVDIIQFGVFSSLNLSTVNSAWQKEQILRSISLSMGLLDL